MAFIEDSINLGGRGKAYLASETIVVPNFSKEKLLWDYFLLSEALALIDPQSHILVIFLNMIVAEVHMILSYMFNSSREGS